MNAQSTFKRYSTQVCCQQIAKYQRRRSRWLSRSVRDYVLCGKVAFPIIFLLGSRGVPCIMGPGLKLINSVCAVRPSETLYRQLMIVATSEHRVHQIQTGLSPLSPISPNEPYTLLDMFQANITWPELFIVLINFARLQLPH
jgi:hypothetical protein